jgi:hypothetical protein
LVYLHTIMHNFGIFWKALECGIFHFHLIYFVVIWYMYAMAISYMYFVVLVYFSILACSTKENLKPVLRSRVTIQALYCLTTQQIA